MYTNNGATLSSALLGTNVVRRIVAVVLGLLAIGAAPASGQGLPDRLSEILRPAGARAGAFVMDATTGGQLFASHAEDRKAPASVEKVYTTTTALRRYGVTGTLDTSAVSAASVGPDGTLGGDLVLKGGGDPTFGSRAFARRSYGGDASVEGLAEQVSTAGVRRVQGNVIGDESAWDSFRGVPDDGLGRVDPDVGPLSALSFDRDLTPGGGAYVLRPAAYAAGKLVTGAAGAGHRRDRDRPGRPGADGDTHAGHGQLARDGNARGPDQPSLGQLPGREPRQGPRRRVRGRRVDRSGRRLVEQTIANDGAHPTVVDGSGLSRSDQTSAHDVVRVLDGVRDDAAGAAFRASLPVAGRTGTLRTRMRGTAAAGRCQAKTGTLSNVSALAGYCRAASGHDVVFALLMNNVGLGTARAQQDRFAAALVGLG
jgi:D-alanyl-D-alanine carboxypeptidase/D-alanyl-D-alanine-endopeptidase (penicillin-binding protein 4)